MLDWGDDDSGLFMKYLRRGSGYYIDVGAAELIIDGRIKLKSGSTCRDLTEHSVILKDGTELPADLVVYATGYGSMNGWAADLISQEVADKVGKCWGLGSGHDQGSRPLGGRAAQHVEADAAGRRCGSTAAICTSRATTRSSCRCSSRRAWKAFRRRSTDCSRFIIAADGRAARPPRPCASSMARRGGRQAPRGRAFRQASEREAA